MSTRNRICIILVSVFYFFGITACGLSAEKGELPIVSELPFIDNKKTITFRSYVVSKIAEDKIFLSKDIQFERTIEKSLKESNYFRIINNISLFESDNILLNSEINKVELDRVKSVEKIIFDTDYFIDIESRPTFVCGTGYVGWALIHWASLGLIPMIFADEIEVKITLYDKNKKTINMKTLKETNKMIAWSPYILTRGASFFPNFTGERETLEINLVNNYLSSIKFDISSK